MTGRRAEARQRGKALLALAVTIALFSGFGSVPTGAATPLAHLPRPGRREHFTDPNLRHAPPSLFTPQAAGSPGLQEFLEEAAETPEEPEESEEATDGPASLSTNVSAHEYHSTPADTAADEESAEESDHRPPPPASRRSSRISPLLIAGFLLLLLAAGAAQAGPDMEVTLTSSAGPTDQQKNTTSRVTANITCTGTGTCGRVNATLRYNASGTEPNQEVETDVNNSTAAPFQVVDNSFQDLSTTDTGGWLGTGAVYGMAYDNSSDLLYIGASPGVDDRFGIYYRSNNTTADLSTADIGDWMGTDAIWDLAYDPVNRFVYIAGAVGRFGVHYPQNNTSINLSTTSTEGWLGGDIARVLAANGTNGFVYLGTSTGHFYLYNVTDNVTLNYTAAVPWVGPDGIWGLAFDLSSGFLYISAENGKFGVYYPQNNTSTDLSATDTGNWLATNHVYALAYDPLQGRIYQGAVGSKFGYYDPATNISTDLSGTDTGGWMSGTVQALAYDPDRRQVFLGLTVGEIGVYNSTTNITSELTATDVGNWLTTNNIQSLAYDSANGYLFLGASNGKLGRYEGGNPRSCGVVNAGQSCILNFTVNATGADASWALDVNYRNNTTTLTNNTSNTVVRIDGTGPTVTIDFPGQFNTTGVNISVQATVTDLNGTAYVEASLSNDTQCTNCGKNFTRTPLTWQGGNTWNGTLNISTVSGDGNYTLRVNATDNLTNKNNATNTTGLGIRIDRGAPTITFLQPTLTQFNDTKDTSFYVKVNATDGADVGFVEASFTTNGSPDSGVNYSRTQLAQVTGPTYAASLNIGALADGNYTIFANASDQNQTVNSNNVTNTTGLRIRVDRTAPGPTFNFPGQFNTTSVGIPVSVGVTDGGVGVAFVEVSLSNDTATEGGGKNFSRLNLSRVGSTNEWTGTLSIAGVGDGNYTLRVNSSDTLGNSNNASNSTGFSIRVDRGAPSVTINFPTGFNVTGVGIPVSATVTDASGVASVEASLSNDTNTPGGGRNFTRTSLTNAGGNVWTGVIYF
ncbi:MAG: hypothetical protein HY558_03860, partial [Euryarchaeota archaeon]|nr:hypothetical protein [Euryarchaeota archaeon]